jgi:molybdenum cofactor cytidylyltransferase
VGMLSRLYPARAIFNPEFEHGEMLSSVQTGLRALDPEAAATLIALGDQPQIEERTVRGLLGMAANIQQRILIPSYQNRRGHPIFFGKYYFDELLNLSAPDNMHTFIQSHLPEIIYLESNPSVLQDVDTLEDYNKATN